MFITWKSYPLSPFLFLFQGISHPRDVNGNWVDIPCHQALKFFQRIISSLSLCFGLTWWLSSLWKKEQPPALPITGRRRSIFQKLGSPRSGQAGGGTAFYTDFQASAHDKTHRGNGCRKSYLFSESSRRFGVKMRKEKGLPTWKKWKRRVVWCKALFPWGK
jgi:hypothetical protein